MLEEIQKTKVLILGFGIEGQATLRYLQKKFPERIFVIADKNKITNYELGITNKKISFIFGENYLKNLDKFDLIIKSPGIKSNLRELQEFKKNGGKIISATNLFMSEVLGTVIGVTGSKGKSTVASLLYAALKKAGKDVELIGNIGNPALDVLEKDSVDKFYVYEMSSYQLEDLEKKPPYVLINNLFPEHLDYHESLENYYKVKLNILKVKEGGKKIKNEKLKMKNHQEEFQKVFYNAGSKELSIRIQKINCQKFPFNDGKSSKIEKGKLVYQDEKILNVKNVKLLGKHNLENILGVIAVSRELGVESFQIQNAISEFKNLEHRLEFVGKFRGILFYNDSISTTPESTIQAIQTFADELDTLILGGLDRGYDFTELVNQINANKIRNLILFPETGERILAGIKNSKLEIKNEKLGRQCLKSKVESEQLHTVKTMEDCVKIAFAKTRKNKVCLLSPAAPSYNLFKNFQERGNLYKKFIKGNLSEIP